MALQILPSKDVGTIVVCRTCDHPEESRNPAYQWTDTNGDVYYEGSTLASLLNFVAEHTS